MTPEDRAQVEALADRVAAEHRADRAHVPTPAPGLGWLLTVTLAVVLVALIAGVWMVTQP